MNLRKNLHHYRHIFIFSFLALLSLLGIFAIFGILFPAENQPIPIEAKDWQDRIPAEKVSDLITQELAAQGKVAGAETPMRVTHEAGEVQADFAFNALGPHWEANLPEGSSIQIEVRYKEAGREWGDWVLVEEDEDADERDPSTGSGQVTGSDETYGYLIPTGNAKHFQYRVHFDLSDASLSPSVDSLTLTYINSRGGKKQKTSLRSIFENALSFVRNLISPLPKRSVAQGIAGTPPTIIDRAGWGADEGLRYCLEWANPETHECNVWGAGGELIWDIEHLPIQKAFVHHTVTNDPDPKAAIRAIYYYHSVTRKWGDIGYNFLIDQNGNIYEGRCCGDGIVGGHVKYFNRGSVGVGVLGDFRYDALNNRIKNALDSVITWKFNLHNVDPNLDSFFVDRVLPSVSWHGMAATTACAGSNLNAYVPQIRSNANHLPREVLVKFKDGVSDGQINGVLSKYGMSVLGSYGGGVKRVRFPNSALISDALNSLRAEGTVAYTEPNGIIRAFLTPTDPDYPKQWSLPKINMPAAWDIQPGGSSSVVVSVLDTGVAYEAYSDGLGTYAKAPDFASTNFVAGYDFVNNDTHPNDDHGHGTAVANVIAATTNNTIGGAGIAYQTSIMPVKVLSESGVGTYTQVADGIRWAADNGAKIINMSLGGTSPSTTLEDAVNYAFNKGVVVIAAAGNSGSAGVLYPAKYSNVVAVGSTRFDDAIAPYSSIGPEVDVVAPGGDTANDLNADGFNDGILMETIDTSFGTSYTNFVQVRWQGTSFAAPHVSGAVALMVAKGSIWPESLARYLKLQAVDLGSSGFDSTYGYGRIQSDLSLNLATSTPPYPDGVLIRTPSRHQVYYLEGGQKRWIPGPDVFNSRFKWEDILITDSFTIDSYPDGVDYRFAEGALLTSNGKVYVMSGGQKRWVLSPVVFEGLGYEWGDILKVSEALLTSYATGAGITDTSVHPDGALITSNGTVYLVKLGQKHWIPDPSIFENTFLRWDWILHISSSKVESYVEGVNVVYGGGVLLHGSTHHVYLISGGQKRHIFSPLTFTDLGFDWAKIITIPDSHLDLYPLGASIY